MYMFIQIYIYIYTNIYIYIYNIYTGHGRKEEPWVVKPDGKRAVMYLARAAGGGVVSAQRELARCCWAGIGMEANVQGQVRG
jgi:hypothetical protein